MYTSFLSNNNVSLYPWEEKPCDGDPCEMRLNCNSLTFWSNLYVSSVIFWLRAQSRNPYSWKWSDCRQQVYSPSGILFVRAGFMYPAIIEELNQKVRPLTAAWWDRKVSASTFWIYLGFLNMFLDSELSFLACHHSKLGRRGLAEHSLTKAGLRARGAAAA